MKTFFKSFVILMLSLSAFLPYSIVSAGSSKATVVNLRGPTVNAVFSDTDSTGCIYTEVFVTASGGTDQELPSQGTPIRIGAVNIYKYDACTDTTLINASGFNDSLPAGDFQISKQLDWASLHTTLNLTDINTNESFAVNVNVNWTGTSDITRNHENTNDIYYRGCHVLNRWKGSGRTANASGTVSDGVTNFTPSASQYADINLVIDGFEVIGCQ